MISIPAIIPLCVVCIAFGAYVSYKIHRWYYGKHLQKVVTEDIKYEEGRKQGFGEIYTYLTSLIENHETKASASFVLSGAEGEDDIIVPSRSSGTIVVKSIRNYVAKKYQKVDKYLDYEVDRQENKMNEEILQDLYFRE